MRQNKFKAIHPVFNVNAGDISIFPQRCSLCFIPLVIGSVWCTIQLVKWLKYWRMIIDFRVSEYNTETWTEWWSTYVFCKRYIHSVWTSITYSLIAVLNTGQQMCFPVKPSQKCLLGWNLHRFMYGLLGHVI